MSYPAFFDAVPRVRLRDPLANFLGAAANGVLEYGYPDAVKLAGHSCPTVASAYWLTWRAIKALYGDTLPERGAIRVDFREDRQSGVTGVIASVVTLLTGATGDTGFKGLVGRFDRRNLLNFSVAVPLDIRFTRTDTGQAVDVAARPGSVPAASEMLGLMQRALSGQATRAEEQAFGELWQERVRCLLVEHGDNPEVFIVRCATD